MSSSRVISADGSIAVQSFDRETEREFRVALRVEQRTSTLVCAISGVIIWSAFAMLDLYRAQHLPAGDFRGQINFILAARTIVLVALIGCAVMVWRGARRYENLVLITYILLGLVTSVSANLAKSIGAFAVDSAQIAIVMAAFLPIGLTFRQALSAAIIVTLMSSAATLLILPADLLHESLQFMLTMVVALVLSATGGYLREKAERKQFRLRKLLATQAAIDPLTGLPNRRTFQWRAEGGLRQCMREGRPAVLAIVDVDHFKKYNDRYGHSEGDIALQKVAAAIQAAAKRPLDVTARFGGEEFCVFLYDTDMSRSSVPLGGILTGVKNLRIEQLEAIDGIMTVSVGAAAFDGSETLDTLFRRADEALYKSKEAGRDQLQFSVTPSA